MGRRGRGHFPRWQRQNRFATYRAVHAVVRSSKIPTIAILDSTGERACRTTEIECSWMHAVVDVQLQHHSLAMHATL